MLFDPVELLVARATQHHEILRPFDTVVLVAVVMIVKRRVVAAAHLATLSGSRKRLHPPHLPLGLLSILRKRHRPQLRGPRLPGKPS